MTEASPPEGWYRDPTTPGLTRWWDGHAWTEHLLPDNDADLGRTGSPGFGADGASPSEASATEALAGDRWAADDPLWNNAGTGAGTGAGTDGSDDVAAGASDAVAAPSPPRWSAPPTSVAELEAGDYAPMAGSWTPSATSAPDGTMRTPASTATLGVWLLVFSPFLILLLVAGVGALVLADPVSTIAAVAGWTASVLTLVWLALAVISDFRRLGALGYHSRPSVLWIVLGPLPYLISRAVHVHRATGRGSASLWTYLLVSLLTAAGAALLALSAAAALPGDPALDGVRDLAGLIGL